jgi:hypothetical protein
MSYDAVQEGTVIARNVSVRVDQADPLKGFTASRRPSLSVRGNMQILTQQHSTANSRYQGAETAHRKETPRERFRGPTPHELAFGRTFSGELCEFGKPVFACGAGYKGFSKVETNAFSWKYPEQLGFV